MNNKTKKSFYDYTTNLEQPVLVIYNNLIVGTVFNKHDLRKVFEIVPYKLVDKYKLYNVVYSTIKKRIQNDISCRKEYNCKYIKDGCMYIIPLDEQKEYIEFLSFTQLQSLPVKCFDLSLHNTSE